MNLLYSLLFAILLAFPALAAETHPGGVNHDLQVNNNGYFGGVTPINGDCLIGSGGAWIAGSCGSSSSPLTTKGDIYAYSTTNARFPIGTDGYVLTADATQTFGFKWAPAGAGSVTTTGSPANGNLTKFSGATSITNADISGDCTTSGTLAITCTKTNSVVFATSATTDTTNATNITSGALPLAQLPKLSRLVNTSYVMSNYGGL